MTDQDKQALAKLCRIEIKRWTNAAESNPNMGYMVELMEAALASLEADNVWINCSERMPDKYVVVLIYVTNPVEVLTAYLNKNNEFCFDRDSEGEYMTIQATHWMPVPAPPGE